jgi:hypothetical protein
MRRHPEASAAVLNGLLILLVPLLFVGIESYLPDGPRDASVTVFATPRSVVGELTKLGPAVLVLLPFATLSAWRTWVHARNRREAGGTGWRGVAESGATALGIALFVLAPGIVTRPSEAPPYVLFYGGSALILGLLVGAVLRTTALLFLRCLRTEAARSTASTCCVAGVVQRFATATIESSAGFGRFSRSKTRGLCPDRHDRRSFSPQKVTRSMASRCLTKIANSLAYASAWA